MSMEFTLYHRGIPIGVGALTWPDSAAVLLAAEPPSPAGAAAAAPSSDLLVLLDFSPLRGYRAIRPVIAGAGRAYDVGGFPAASVHRSSMLSPTRLPAEDRAAFQTVRALWAELELRDRLGRVVAAAVTWFLEFGDTGRARVQQYWLVVRLGRAEAAVLAALAPDPRSAGARRDPAA